jgi:aminomethyltransferase
LKQTPLHDLHEQLGARMVEFAGYHMPVQYSGIKAEHGAVREAVGLFDVSHMGQLHLMGADAAATVDRLCSRRISDLAVGRVRYALLCNESGGVVDDVTVYRTGDDAFFLCVNAANVDKDRDWVISHVPGGVEVRDQSQATGLIAVQGPLAVELMARVAPDPLAGLRRFAFERCDVAGKPTLVSRTGYTGADGFELYCRAEDAVALFEALLREGETLGVQPIGLGARDTLRLEAALALYGHELDDTTSPLEAGLDPFVDRDGDFIGADAIRRRESEGHPRRLVGFEVTGRGIARDGHEVTREGEPVGVVTSGAPSPTLGKSIGLAYVPPSLAGGGTGLEILVRGRPIPARVVDTPFVKGVRAGRRPPAKA